MPIRPISKEENNNINYDFLNKLDMGQCLNPDGALNKKYVTASNKDATLLYELWQKGTSADNNRRVFDLEKSKQSAKLSAMDITKLKTLGFISGNGDKVAFTEKGKKVLITMTLSEPNKFALRAQAKPYNEILASLNSRKKKTGTKTAEK